MSAKTDDLKPAALTEYSCHYVALRSAVAELGPAGLSRLDLPEVRAELDVARSEAAHGVERIIRAIETLLSFESDGVEAYRAELGRQATVILEACSFQDISGQRLSRVEGLLVRLQSQMTILADTGGVEDAARVETADDFRRRELHLNGPARNAPHVGQSEIDALFD